MSVLTNVHFVPCSQSTLEERVPVWFVLDEFGSSIQHSCWPSFAMVPFYYVPKQDAYSVIWPLRDVAYGGIASVHRHTHGHTYTNWHASACTDTLTRALIHDVLCSHTHMHAHTYPHTHTFMTHTHTISAFPLPCLASTCSLFVCRWSNGWLCCQPQGGTDEVDSLVAMDTKLSPSGQPTVEWNGWLFTPWDESEWF